MNKEKIEEHYGVKDIKALVQEYAKNEDIEGLKEFIETVKKIIKIPTDEELDLFFDF